MPTKVHSTGRSTSGVGRLLIVAAAVAIAILLWWVFASSEPAPDARRPAIDPAWDKAYDRLVGAAGPAGQSGGIVVQGSTPGRALGGGMLLAPRQSGGVTTGYVIAAASDAAALTQAKLRPGDVLLDIDGRALDDERVRALADELAPADAVEITFERQGQIRKRLIDLNR